MPTAGSIYYFASRPSDENQPTVVLIHGAGGTHLHWPYNLRRLNNHRVLAPDLPGHGKSEGIGEQDISRYADRISTWLEDLDVRQAVVIGHSMGGAIAQSLALMYPEQVTRLILISTGAVLPVNAELLEKMASPATAPAALDLIVKWSYSRDADPKLLQTAREQMDAVRPTVTYGDFLACSQFDSTRQLGDIAVPTLVLCGELDKMTPPRFSQQLQENIPNASLKMIPEAGHMLMLEQPERTAVEILGFLKIAEAQA